MRSSVIRRKAHGMMYQIAVLWQPSPPASCSTPSPVVVSFDGLFCSLAGELDSFPIITCFCFLQQTEFVRLSGMYVSFTLCVLLLYCSFVRQSFFISRVIWPVLLFRSVFYARVIKLKWLLCDVCRGPFNLSGEVYLCCTFCGKISRFCPRTSAVKNTVFELSSGRSPVTTKTTAVSLSDEATRRVFEGTTDKIERFDVKKQHTHILQRKEVRRFFKCFPTATTAVVCSPLSFKSTLYMPLCCESTKKLAWRLD